MDCDLCGATEAYPFRCRYCSGTFCTSHRLPVSHNCAFVSDYRQQPSRNREYIERLRGKSSSAPQRVKAAVKDVVMLRFSKIEIVHLAIATTLVSVVGASFFNYTLNWEFLLVFVSAFVIHELGHKFLAQFYRAWAEFRVILFGAAITAFSALPFSSIKFIAPGAVVVSGDLSRDRSGKVSWIGPLTNIVMAAGFLIAYYLFSGQGHFRGIQILLIGARFNGIIALFNLIPFMGLDGEKIFWWRKLVWLVTVAAAGALYIVTDLLSGGSMFGFLRRYI